MTHSEALNLLNHHQGIAAQYSATCPLCAKSDRKIVAQFRQATRQEPIRFLCYQGWCVDCQMSFPAENMQAVLA